jgi:hypothetical protein
MVRLPTRPVWPPAPGTETLGAILGTRGHVRVMAVKLWCQHTFWWLRFGESLVRSKPRHSTSWLPLRSAIRTSSWHCSMTCRKKSARRSRNARRLERRRKCRSFLHATPKIITAPSRKSMCSFFLRSSPQKRYTWWRYRIHLPMSLAHNFCYYTSHGT